MKKEEIRPRVKAWKAVLTDAEKAEAARAAFAMLERHAAFMMAENILMYHRCPMKYRLTISSTAGPGASGFTFRVSTA